MLFEFLYIYTDEFEYVFIRLDVVLFLKRLAYCLLSFVYCNYSLLFTNCTLLFEFHICTMCYYLYVIYFNIIFVKLLQGTNKNKIDKNK